MSVNQILSMVKVTKLIVISVSLGLPAWPPVSQRQSQLYEWVLDMLCLGKKIVSEDGGYLF